RSSLYQYSHRNYYPVYTKTNLKSDFHTTGQMMENHPEYSTVTEEITEKSIMALIEILQEDHVAKENIIAKIQTKFPEYADRTEDLVERCLTEH
ncbi:MAG: hypothetical protein HDR06_07435, partial [Lachnospiraceae bacterium]|nr:hypothetical protein [Lachnospiraceae bacterium]